MSSTNKTTYYDLPQFVDSDLFNPLVDDNDAYDKIDTALHNIAELEAGDASEIVGVKSRVTTAEGKIEALETQNGSEALATTAQTLSGAVNELDADVASLDGRVDTVEDDINNANTGLKVKVTNLSNKVGNEPLNTTAQTVSGAVNELNNDVKANNDLITNSIKSIDTDLILDGFLSEPLFVQGATYYKDNMILCYLTNGTESDIGYLNCYSLTNHSLMWSYPIKGYHGNSLVYREVDNCLYICACKHQNAPSAINIIVVVDMATPNAVKEEIIAPTTLMTICYDDINDVFYGSNSWGYFYKFSGIFESIDETIYTNTSDLPFVLVRQPATLYKNGVVYYFGTEVDNSFILGFDAVSGERTYFARINGFINGYRSVGELESLFYNPNDDNFVCGSMTSVAYTGVKDKAIFNFFNVGLYKSLNAITLYAYDDISDISSFASLPPYFICNGVNDLTPWKTSPYGYFKCLGDIRNVLRLKSYQNCHLVFIGSYNNYSGELEIGDFDLEDFNGFIEPVTPSILTINKLHINGNNTIRFERCHFVNSYQNGNIKANFFVTQSANVKFEDCEFNDFDTDETVATSCHILVGRYSSVTIALNNTFNGAKNATYKSYGADVLIASDIAWQTQNGNQNYETADTWQKVNFQFTVPTERVYMVDISTGGNNSNADCTTGIAVTSQYVNDLTTNRYRANYYFEDADGIAYTPMLFLQAGTYNLWVKRNAVSSACNFIIRYRDVT